jgi:hypothetical protein
LTRFEASRSTICLARLHNRLVNISRDFSERLVRNSGCARCETHAGILCASNLLSRSNLFAFVKSRRKLVRVDSLHNREHPDAKLSVDDAVMQCSAIAASATDEHGRGPSNQERNLLANVFGHGDGSSFGFSFAALSTRIVLKLAVKLSPRHHRLQMFVTQSHLRRHHQSSLGSMPGLLPSQNIELASTLCAALVTSLAWRWQEEIKQMTARLFVKPEVILQEIARRCGAKLASRRRFSGVSSPTRIFRGVFTFGSSRRGASRGNLRGNLVNRALTMSTILHIKPQRLNKSTDSECKKPLESFCLLALINFVAEPRRVFNLQQSLLTFRNPPAKHQTANL